MVDHLSELFLIKTVDPSPVSSMFGGIISEKKRADEKKEKFF